MMKTCVVLNGEIINIGPWDYGIKEFEITPPEYDQEGNITKEGVYEDRPTNLLPEGAAFEEREVAQDADGGWYVVGQPKPPTPEDRIQFLEDALLNLLLGG